MVLAMVLAMVHARTAAAEPRRFAIDAAASRVVVHVGKTGVFRFAGHDHEVVLPVRAGAGVVDPANVDRSSIELDLDATAARVTGRGEPAKDVPKVQETMLGPDCLDVRRFPTIHFVSTGVSAKGARAADFEATIRGTLTLHGVSRPMTVTAHVALDQKNVTAAGTLELKQSDFGIKPVSVGGVVKVEDRITITWRLVGRTTQP
jgi:polyisoprenoid-binding protein YceI